jgi:hypothetical protein
MTARAIVKGLWHSNDVSAMHRLGSRPVNPGGICADHVDKCA